MAIIATAGETYTPAPAGLHQAICVDVVDLGFLEVTYANKTKKQHKIRVVWQIDELDDAGKRHLLFKRYTLSLNEKSTLRKDLESWRGRTFTRDEEMGFDVEKLIGANCQVNVQHAAKNGNTYANVVSIVPLGRGMAKIDASNYVREKDRTPEQQTAEPVTELTDDDIPF